MQDDLLARYESAMLDKRRAELKLAELKAEAMKYVRDNGKQEQDGARFRFMGNNGQFFLTKYVTYEFSPAVEEALERVKALKQLEIDNNIAKKGTREVLMFKSL